MMERIDALKELAAKVEAGMAGVNNFSMVWPHGDEWNAAQHAYGGSRDAAKALRDATLPGWHIIIWGHKEFCVTAQNPEARHVKGAAKGACEARTELLAILRALIAKEGE